MSQMKGSSATRKALKGGYLAVAMFLLAGGHVLPGCGAGGTEGKGAVAPPAAPAPTVASPPPPVASSAPVAAKPEEKPPIVAKVSTPNGEVTLVPGTANVVSLSASILQGARGLRVRVQLPIGSLAASAGDTPGAANGKATKFVYTSVSEVTGWTTIIVAMPEDTKTGDSYDVQLPFKIVEGQWAVVTLKVG